MKFIEVTSEDRSNWLLWRHGGLGSSDIAVIMGTSRFKTEEQLRLEKAGIHTGEDDTNTYIKNRGNKIEGHVREFMENERGCKFPPLSGYNSVFPYMRASLDGITEDRKTLIEIKLLSSQNPAKLNKQTDGYIKWEAVREKGVVPAEYYPQLQHQLFVTGADRVIFSGYKEIKGEYFISKDKLAEVDVLPDMSYIEEMVSRASKFWLSVEQLRKQLGYKGELG